MSVCGASRSPHRYEWLRWVGCFGVVVAGHGLAAMALLSPPEDFDFGIDVPVVTVELPESLVANTAPRQDLPPGPVAEEESQARPAQKEDTKPPEPESELALPLPQFEPPSEEKQATAPATGRTPPKSVVRWQSLLAAHIAKFQRYPSAARANREQGVARVEFTIDRQGRLLTSRIVQSSGWATLDEETLALLARAQPLPRPPEQAIESDLLITTGVNFKTP
jgi:protein TonB